MGTLDLQRGTYLAGTSTVEKHGSGVDPTDRRGRSRVLSELGAVTYYRVGLLSTVHPGERYLDTINIPEARGMPTKLYKHIRMTAAIGRRSDVFVE